MTEAVKKLYKSSIKNKLFLQEIYEADKDTKPSMFASEGEKIMFASIYYGWLVGKYGVEWESHL